MKNNTKKIYTGLDIGKFICSILILLYHYYSEYESLPNIFNEMLSLYAIAVALFMTISGFLTFEKLENIVGTTQRWLIVKKQVKRVFSIYILWSIPYILFTISQWNWSNISISFIFWQIQEWLFKQTFYTIWFMPSLAVGLIFTFWITEKIPECVVYLFGLICYITGSLCLTYSYFGNMIPNFTLFSKFVDIWLGGPRGWLFFAFPFLIVGKEMVKHKDKINCFLMIPLSCFFIIMILIEALLLRQIAGHTGIDMTIMMIPSVYCILGFLVNANFPEGNYCTWIRKMSTLIFMSQRIFLTVLPSLFPVSVSIIYNNTFIGFFINCISVFIFSELIIILSKKIRWMKLLY